MIATIFRYRDSGEFQVHDRCSSDHIHLLLSLDDERPLSQGDAVDQGRLLARFAREHHFVANGLAAELLRQAWRDVDEFAEFAKYVRENPVRRGLVDDAAKYPYSSAACREGVDEFQGLKPLAFRKGGFDAGPEGFTPTRSVRTKSADLEGRALPERLGTK